MSAALLVLVLAAAPRAARAQEDVPSVQGAPADQAQQELLRRVKEELASDPARADALAERILRSRLGAQLSETPDAATTRAGLADWMRAHPDAAAELAVGFAGDDARGDHAYESSLTMQAKNFLELSPDRDKGLLGRLKGLGKAAKRLSKQAKMSDDDRRRLVKEMFEGRSTVDRAAGAGPEGGPGPGRASPAVADDGLYDRLSPANVTGYSPQVQTLQNELNRSAPPGAPRLAETGRLDYATLAFPAYSVRYDLDRLEAAWARDAAAARAAALGEKVPPARLAD
ncbi:MAG: hypothetical protein KGL53_01780, partial [Elusimicrobia bacterium]|nr:hypothetical protein [Elusimicrobiota bacterium]